MSIGNINSRNNFIVNNNSNINTSSDLYSSKSSTFNDKLKGVCAANNNDAAANILKEINNEADSTDREEDRILYNEMKHMIKKDSDLNLQTMKQAIVTFPPATAPGYVRKAFSEALEKLPESQRNQIAGGLNIEYGGFVSSVKDGTFKINSDKSVYESFMDYINKAIDSEPNFLGTGSSQYIKSLLSDFQSNLEN